jgi:VanZ family protein
LRWLLWGTYVTAWTTALLTPQPVDVADAVLPTATSFFFAKSLHVGAYAMLTVLSGWLPLPARFRWLALVFVSVHAWGTEFLQGFVPARYPSLLDVGFDHLGILVGVAVTWRWWRDKIVLAPEPPGEVESSVRGRV